MRGRRTPRALRPHSLPENSPVRPALAITDGINSSSGRSKGQVPTWPFLSVPDQFAEQFKAPLIELAAFISAFDIRLLNGDEIWSARPH